MKIKNALVVMLVVALLVCVPATPVINAIGTANAQEPGDSVASVAPVALVPTNHPRVSKEPSELWLVPDKTPARSPAVADLVKGVRLEAKGEYSKALPVLAQPSVQEGALGEYAMYYAGIASLKLGYEADAKRTFKRLQESQPIGYLSLAAGIGEAETDEATQDFSAAVSIYEGFLKAKLGSPDDLWMRIGLAAQKAGDTAKAGEAFGHVYYEFALSDLAQAAGVELLRMPSLQPLTPGSERFKLELGRAEQLFGARQYGPAHAAFEALRSSASGDDEEVVRLRIAESDFYEKKFRMARDELRSFTDHGARQGEAQYFSALASYELKDEATYLQAIRDVADRFPTETWADDALDSLATHYILNNDDAQADVVLRELYAKYARGAHGDRAAWKIGWRSYREGRYGETVTYFERAAADFPHSDYRPAWIYWAGRAHDQLNERALAAERYELVTADYLNSYYGRLALNRLDGRTPASRVIATAAEVASGATQPLPMNAPLVRTLIGAGLLDEALSELQFADRAWGPTSVTDATRAWIYRQQAHGETGTERFNLVRGSMTTMKRAYPQYMAAGGEQLPRDLLTIIFPLEYWDLIQKYSSQHNLDPYVVAALMAQESTFVPDIVSYAKAVGLMQLEPATARQYARKLNVPYSARLLRNPEANIRLGTALLSDTIGRFGSLYLALASYNAGDTPVRRWLAQHPADVDADEFIDDIPYPQTQLYVKKIIGTAEDYRRLYKTQSGN